MTFAADLRTVLRGEDFRRLFAVRLTSQASDGVVNVGLASLFFFSPERATSPAGVAASFAVLLLPFTLVGPWAGVFLDRWRRRQVLVVGNAVRALLVLLAALMVGVGVDDLPLYVTVLVALSVNRFLLAGMSTALPHVVPRHELVMANSVSPTCGTFAALLGGALAFGLSRLGASAAHTDSGLLVLAAAGMLVASALGRRMDPDLLGPDEPHHAPSAAHALRAVGREMDEGLRHVMHTRSPAHGLAAIGLHRFAYGLSTIATILLARNRLTDAADVDAGLAVLGLVVAAAGAGLALAAVLTPVAAARLRPEGWLTACLLLAAAAELMLVVTIVMPVLLAGAFVLGVAAQGIKICVDTIVQRDIDDAFRGRVFTVYDVVFNAAFVAAAALAVLVVPADGYSRALYAGTAVAYLVTAGLYHHAEALHPRGRAAVRNM